MNYFFLHDFLKKVSKVNISARLLFKTIINWLSFRKISLNHLIFLSLISVLSTPCSLLYSQSHSLKSGNLEYIENKNQWDGKILYKADIENGAVFIENNCLTFNFINPEDISFTHAHYHTGKDNKPPDIIHFHSYKIQFLNSNLTSGSGKVYGTYPKTDYCNYFVGNDKNKWASYVKKFRMVSYDNIYKNIDLNVYSSGNNLKYDFVIHPGGNVNDISLKYEGLKNMKLKNDYLLLETSFNSILELKPDAYIQNPQNKSVLTCRYILKDNIIKFSIKDYDKSKVLVIDPQLIFSTYSGSLADNWGFTATYDNNNNVYSGGIVFGVGYPVSLGAYQQKFGGDTANYWGSDIGIIKYDPTGKNRLYATYLGGKEAEMPHSLIVNQFNELLIFGTTSSSNYPVSADAYSKTFKGGKRTSYDFGYINFVSGTDIFITKLSADGSKLLASTFVGGSDNDGINYRDIYAAHTMHGNDSLFFNYGDDARGEIITDDQNNVYVGSCTFSDDFPVTSSAFRQSFSGKEEGVVFKLDYNLTNLIWSSYLGGSADDAIYSIDVDNFYNIYVAGGTNSSDFPTSAKAFHKNFLGGSADGFVSYISGDGTKLLNSTYFGSSKYDQAYFVRTDDNNYPYITGQTKAPGSELIYNSNYHTPNSGQFIAKLTPSLDTIKWSTVFGTGDARPNISITAFAVDICDKIYLAGWGREWAYSDSINWDNIHGTKNMDITTDAVQKITDGQDFYVMVLTDNASQLYYATYFGEVHYDSCFYSGHDHVDGGTSRFDKRGNVYESVCGSCGQCQHFPTYPKPGAWSNKNKSNNCNNAVFKINIFKGFALADFEVPNTGCAPYTVNIINKSEGTTFYWNFGDNSTSAEKNPVHTFKKAGTYDISLIVIDSMSCNFSDTISKQLQILSDTTSSLPDIQICKGDKKQIGLQPFNDSTITYRWAPQNNISNADIPNPYAYPDITTRYMLLVNNKICTDTIFQNVIVHTLIVNPGKDTSICSGSGFLLTAIATGESPFKYQWSSTSNFNDYLNPGSSDNTALVKPLADKTYYIKVTNNICEAIDSMRIKLSEIRISAIKDTTVCKDDTIKLKVFNNNPSDILTFTWQPAKYIISGQSTSSVVISTSSLPSTPYYFYVKVINQYGCSITDSIKLNLNEVKADSVIKDAGCFAECNGKIKVIPFNGSSPYSYKWENGTKEDTLTKLCAGNYKITITDNKGCKFYHDYKINSPVQLTVKDVVKTNVLCNGNCDGTATVTGSGGTPPYRYIWINGQRDSIVKKLCAGSYSVTITDKNGCTATASVDILDTSTFKVELDTSSIRCNGDCNGSAALTVTGGKLPYSFLWDDGQTESVAKNFCAGNHNVIVTESNGCKRQLYFNLFGPYKIQAKFTLVNKLLCFGDCIGKLFVDGKGGMPPLSYSWSNGQTKDTIQNLCAGNYFLTITDNNMCTGTFMSTVTSPPQLLINLYKTNVPCSVICNGSAKAFVSGGTPYSIPNVPYIYAWSNGKTGDTINKLCNGNYSFTVTDSNLCKAIQTFTIKDSSTFPVVKVYSDYDSIHPGQTTVIHTSPILPGYTYKWSPPDGLNNAVSSEPKASPVKTTTYYVTITDAFGCTYKDSIDIRLYNVICNEPYIFIPNAFTPDADINNVLYVRSAVIEKLHLAVYDRWGEKVFETTDISRGWDGTAKGRKCNPGVFDYYIEATCLDKENYKHKGNITLIR